MASQNERVELIFRQVMGPIDRGDLDDVTPDNFEGWDSSRHVELALALEREFQIELSPDEVIELESVSDAKEIVRRRTKTKGQ